MAVTLRTKHYKSYGLSYGSFYRLRTAIGEYAGESASGGTLLFLYQHDFEGKLKASECEELLNDIKDMPDKGILYGYVTCGKEASLTISKFKEMLQIAVSHVCSLTWR